MATSRTPPALAALIALVFALAMPSPASAKAAFASKTEMVDRSAVVAVVDITAVETVSIKGEHWTYGQRAKAVVKQVLKGPLVAGAEIKLHGDEDFICARCHFAPGRSLVFLTEDKTTDGSRLWIGSNWHLSIRPITADPSKGDRVEWYKDDKNIELAPAALADVLADVRQLVDRQKGHSQPGK